MQVKNKPGFCFRVKGGPPARDGTGWPAAGGRIRGLMPVECKIDKERRLVIGSAWGAISFADVKGYQDKLRADPEFNPEFDQLMDGTGITDWLLTIEEAEAATRRRFFSPGSKRAYVRPVPTTAPLARILNAYCEMTKDASHIRVFDDMPSAWQWLGLRAIP